MKPGSDDTNHKSLPDPVGQATLENARRALDELLAQVADVAESLDDADYGQLEERIFRSSPGGHVRHMLDHVRALLQGLESGLVCYDRRVRGTPIENDRAACLAEIEVLRQALARLDTHDCAALIRIEQLVDPAREALILQSTVLRELVFVFHHGIHHAAQIAARLRHAGRTVPANFGIAPATLAAAR